MDARGGRLNRKRGISFEREVAALVGGKRTGMFGGKDDVTSDRLVIQSAVKGIAGALTLSGIPPAPPPAAAPSRTRR